MSWRPAHTSAALTLAALASGCTTAPPTSDVVVPRDLREAGPVDPELLALMAEVPAEAAAVAAFWPDRAADLPYDPGQFLPFDDPEMGAALTWARDTLGPVAAVAGLAEGLPIVAAAGLTRDHDHWALATLGALPDLSEVPPVGILLVVPGDPISLLAALDAIPGTSVEPFAHGVTMRPQGCSPARCAWMGQTAARRPHSPAWESFLRTPAALKIHVDLGRWQSLSTAVAWRRTFGDVSAMDVPSRGRAYTLGHAHALEVAAAMAPRSRYASEATLTVSDTAGLLVRHTATLTPAGARAYAAARQAGRGRAAGCDEGPDAPVLCISVPFSPRVLRDHLPTATIPSRGGPGRWRQLAYGLANSAWGVPQDLSYPDAAEVRMDPTDGGMAGVFRWYDTRQDPAAPPASILGMPLDWEADDSRGWYLARLGARKMAIGDDPPVDDVRVLFAAHRSASVSVVVPGAAPLPDVDVLDLRVRSEGRCLASSVHLRDAAAPPATPILHTGWGTKWARESAPRVCDHAPTWELAGALHDMANANTASRDEAEAALTHWFEAAAGCADADLATSIKASWFLFRARTAFWASGPEAAVLARQACELGRPAGCNLADDIEETARQGTAAPGPGEMTVVGPDGPAPPHTDAGALRRVVRAHRDRLRACIERGTTQDPDASAPLRVEFTIGSSGTVLAATVTGPEVMRACIEGVILEMSFPPIEGGGTVKVSYPLLFEPAH